MIISIDTLNTSPIYEQLRDQIVLGIAAGQFEAGESLPSVRRLAADLGVNFHTVNKSYRMLCDEGYIVMDRRKGAVIAGEMPRNEELDLSRKLRLLAAEAICRGIGEDEFLKICGKNFREVLT
ncbi:MAG: GntR family transcriptional regulator [Defluviitaleaceae bacterium]|nr:GntR family transcriptional regulator [Defluviitaleaceae bacterium]